MKWIRRTLKGISLTAAMFVFQACYGTWDDYYDAPIEFRVLSYETGQPLQGIEVWFQSLNGDSSSVGHPNLQCYTDENGTARSWVVYGLHRFSFVDKDSAFQTFDTIVKIQDKVTVGVLLKKAE